MHISVLEDEVSLSEQLSTLLKSQGHTVSLFSNGLDLIRFVREDIFDLYVLDWQVPGATGVEVLRYIREIKKINKPVIFLTSNDRERDVISVFDNGADDYCIKPLKPAEFNARVSALGRRAYPQKVGHGNRNFWGYSFDISKHIVTFGNKKISLSDKEFNLALYLFENAEAPISRQKLINEVWLQETDSLTRSLDVHISWLRKKLDLSPSSDRINIKAIHGYGYRLVGTPQSDFT